MLDYGHFPSTRRSPIDLVTKSGTIGEGSGPVISFSVVMPSKEHDTLGMPMRTVEFTC